MDIKNLKDLLGKVSAQPFRSALDALRGAEPGKLFEVLEAALNVPGVKVVERLVIAAGEKTPNGWVVPPRDPAGADQSGWPILIVEVPGVGVPYMKVQIIRVNAYVVPLGLDGGEPKLEGAALAVAVLRTLGDFTQRRGVKLQRSARFVFTSSARALEIFFQRYQPLGACYSAMDLDLGSATSPAAQPALEVDSPEFVGRSFVTELLLQELGRERALTVKEGRPTVASPALEPLELPYASLKGRLDASSKTSDRVVAAIERALLRSMVFLGDTDYAAGLAFARPRVQAAAKAMKARPSAAPRIYEKLKGVLRGYDQLMHPGPWWTNPKATLERHRRQGILIDGIYYPRAAYQVWQTREDDRLKALLPPKPAKKTVAATTSAAERKAQKFVPARTFRGVLALEDVTKKTALAALRRLGLKSPAAIPLWMQCAANLAAGKKTVADIRAALLARGFKISLGNLMQFFAILEQGGKVRRRPVLSDSQILAALRQAGVQPGDTIMVHVGFAVYGYIPSGPLGLIDIFQKAVGPQGTLCMPTHTGSLVGYLPFDPVRSLGTGLVPSLFIKVPGTIRGLHPTHSVTARGPKAAWLLERADEREPLFGREGFWGRFHDSGGKIVMFCNTIYSNTFLHGVDYWGGAPLPDMQGHVIRNGRRQEVLVRGGPFHIDSFSHIYKVAEPLGLVHEAPLGEGKVYVMDAQKLARVGVPVVRQNPLLAGPPGCSCDYCRHLRRVVARRKK